MHLTSTNSNKLKFNDLEKHLLNDFQHGFPLVSRPYRSIAKRLGTSEKVVINTLKQLMEKKVVTRVGAVFRANSIGASCLVAMSIPESELEEIALMINSYSEVNHNYQREHLYNLWFVLTAKNEQVLNSILDDIEQRSGISVMYLPMLEDYHIDLGFDLEWT